MGLRSFTVFELGWNQLTRRPKTVERLLGKLKQQSTSHRRRPQTSHHCQTDDIQPRLATKSHFYYIIPIAQTHFPVCPSIYKTDTKIDAMRRRATLDCPYFQSSSVKPHLLSPIGRWAIFLRRKASDKHCLIVPMLTLWLGTWNHHSE